MTLPALPHGYHSRPPTPADAPAVHHLITACETTLHGHATTDLDRVTADLGTPGASSILIHGDGGKPAGWGWVRGRRATVHVHPAHTGRGLGSWLLDWTEAWGTDRLAQSSPLAFMNGQLVGAVLSLDVPGDEGYVERVAVRRDQRGRGIARLLLLDSFRTFQRQGRRGCVLWTHSDTGALALYERVGMAVRRGSTVLSKTLSAGRTPVSNLPVPQGTSPVPRR
ncbi:GNAT family N-acetyltransferase [Streptomyces roseirectus]|uniref:GNAT family N-acetyltransferase n=1 Tax=Streptomyces roseirectus TaxID=2768066 RepID=A0A7H0I733_9ACTN|nr:GNAT family N-acetyltransferase [Streptomyces roseirectus]QNP68599.1 GNAT family N-acetyltransferase [Streptomyces roseirectus]